MTKVDVTVSVEKSGLDLVQHVAKLIKAFKTGSREEEIKAIVDGFQPIVADLGAMKTDLAEDQMGFIKGVNLGAYELLDAIKG
jgi:hypothetical protein